MNIRNEIQQLADRCVSAFNLNQNNNTSSIAIKMYVNGLYKHLGVSNKTEEAKKEAVTDEAMLLYNDFYINSKTQKMVSVPYFILVDALKLAELQEETLSMLYSGKGNITTYEDEIKTK